MSYPSLIQPLIIEDDVDAHYLYDIILQSLSDQFSLAPAQYAYCYEDAIKKINSETIFHLVILDLRLPECPGMPPRDGVDLGLALLEDCIKRDSYPIPALLVISGEIGQAKQSELEEKVRDGFSYGRVFVKGPDMEDELRVCIEKVKTYTGIGIHVRDGGTKSYPTLSPREDDLLRRCALAQEGSTGLDLDWWSTEFQPPVGDQSEYSGWKKVLMGRFLFNHGDKPSRPNFFKVSPAVGAEVTLSNAKRMGHKLSHIKINGALMSNSRSLLVTEKVGEGADRPISLLTYLNNSEAKIKGDLTLIVNDIVTQLAALGDTSPRALPMKDLLWTFHEKARLKEQWDIYGGESILERLGLKADPFVLLDSIQVNNKPIRYEQQTFLHSDLNITNVALDKTPGRIHAYIFDAEGCQPGVKFRDLAMLEVTSLLHQLNNGKDSLVDFCSPLYEEQIFVSDLDISHSGTDQARNTFKLINEIRAAVGNQPTDLDSFIYALMVFDNALMQFGGLSYTISRNKISNPREAAVFLALAGKWLQSFLECI